MSKSKRRDFLRNSALAGLLAPVAALWPDLPEARAQDERTNMVLVYLPNGSVPGNPFLNPGVRPDFAEGFRPYNEFSDRTIAFREYATDSFMAAEYRGEHRGHLAGGMTMFSGQVPISVGAMGGQAPTVDQIVAWDYLERGIVTNPLRKSLNVRIGDSSLWIDQTFVQTPPDYRLGQTYNRTLSGVSQVVQPQRGFDQLFGDIAAMNGGASVDELWAHGRSILDMPAAEIRSVRSQMPSEGQHVLAQHLDALRDLERGFEAEAGREDALLETPSAPGEMDVGPENYERVFEHWARLIDAAFRLDRTRIVSIQFGGLASRFRIPSLGLSGAGGTDFHSISHHSHSDVPKFMNWFAERVASLLRRLRGDEGGTDILSRSAVMVGMEFGSGGGDHSNRDMPVTIFGECGGYFDTGKVVTYGNGIESYRKHTGTLLGMARAMGTDVDAIGHPNAMYQAGVPDELRRR